MQRFIKLQELKKHPVEKKLFKKLSKFELSYVDAFVFHNRDLSTNDWAEKVNRLFLNDPDKPKNHKDIWAILLNLK